MISGGLGESIFLKGVASTLQRTVPRLGICGQHMKGTKETKSGGREVEVELGGTR